VHFQFAFFFAFVYYRPGVVFMIITRLSYRAFILISAAIFLFGCAHPSVPITDGGKQKPLRPAAAADEGTANFEGAPESQDTLATEPVSSSQTDQTEKHELTAKKDAGDDDQEPLDTALELTETAQEYWKDGDMDHAIESLDQAYALILTVPSDNPKLSQQKDDLRFMISKRIMELYASRQVAVKGNHDAIPMVVNDHVQREIQSFQTVERDFFLEAYKRSGRYRGGMVKALKAAGLPEELSWLPLIESGFKVRALSRSRAFGLWQFIPSTGYKYGLARNAWIDERLDPKKSTAAAIEYFKELHQMFGDWATVLAAYNCGEGSVARVIRDSKIDYLDNFWDFYQRLPRETARYFPRFLAVLAIVKDPAKYGFTLDQPDQPLSYETCTVERPVNLKSVAEKLNVDLEDLTQLNPELRRDATPDKPYLLRVPPGKRELLTAVLGTLPKWMPPKVEYVMHRVRRGETLSLIALRYRTSIKRILQTNNIRSTRLLRVGQRLKIPTRSAT
jgi:membrane-bound lytic murein transglycosylase D